MPETINCTSPENCDNESCQTQIADNHEIDESTFDEMVARFFSDNPVPDPLVLTSSEIAAMVEVDCSSHRITFTVPDDQSTQQDIDLTVVTGYSPTTGSILNYSIALLRGVLLKNPDEVRFFKAKNSNDESTLVFQAIRNNVSIYSGNVSNLYP